MSEPNLQTPVDDITDEVIRVLLKHDQPANAELVNDIVSALLDFPISDDFFLGVKQEAMHQIKRWGTKHDAGKTDFDWLSLILYLASKAVHVPAKRDHHIITTAAALLNWHLQRKGESDIRPGTGREVDS